MKPSGGPPVETCIAQFEQGFAAGAQPDATPKGPDRQSVSWAAGYSAGRAAAAAAKASYRATLELQRAPAPLDDLFATARAMLPRRRR